jgi:hypothetical protein
VTKRCQATALQGGVAEQTHERAKSALIAFPLLVVITLLPVSTAMNVTMDLWEGPALQPASNNNSGLYLKYTGRTLDR